MNSRDMIRGEIIDVLFNDQADMATLCKHIPQLETLKGVSQPPYHSKDVFGHTELVVNGVPKYMVLKLTALLHDIAKPQTRTGDENVAHFYDHENIGAIMAQNILGELGFAENIIRDVYILISWHMKANQYKSDSSAKFVRKIYEGTDQGRLISFLCYHSLSDRTSDKIGADYNQEKARVYELYDRVTNLDVPIIKYVDTSPLTGTQIMKILNIPQSKEVGILKKRLADSVYRGHIEVNDESEAEIKLKEIYEEMKREQNGK